MKKSNTLLLGLLLAVALSACGKKDSSFAARYAKNASGATAVDVTRNQRAAEVAQTYGLKNLDVINISKQGSSGAVQVSSTILLNDTALDIRSEHTGANEVTTQLQISGYNVYVNTMCSNANCDIYFVMLTAYQGNTPVMQAGVMRYFTDTSRDRYQWVQGGSFIPFYGNEWKTPGTMIGILLTSAGF